VCAVNGAESLACFFIWRKPPNSSETAPRNGFSSWAKACREASSHSQSYPNSRTWFHKPREHGAKFPTGGFHAQLGLALASF